MPTGSRRQAGFTYVGLLIAVVFFGMGSVGAARLLASTERAEREAELLFFGNQFRQAIRSYVQAGPGHYPATLKDLLLDPRYPTPRRHLRRLFVDPITGKPDWGLVIAPEGGIMGVHSLSSREPLKRANFEPQDSEFALALQLPQTAPGQTPGPSKEGSLVLTPLTAASSAVQLSPLDKVSYSYREWRFVYRPAASGGLGRRTVFGGGA